MVRAEAKIATLPTYLSVDACSLKPHISHLPAHSERLERGIGPRLRHPPRPRRRARDSRSAATRSNRRSKPVGEQTTTYRASAADPLVGAAHRAPRFGARRPRSRPHGLNTANTTAMSRRVGETIGGKI